MKHTAGYAKPIRMTAPARRSRLELQRRPKPQPEENFEARQESSFWKWVGFVALLHVLAILALYAFFAFTSPPRPSDHFMSLLPPGDTVRGTVGTRQAHKMGAPVAAAPSHAAAQPPPPSAAPAPQKVVPPPPVAKPATPLLRADAPLAAPVKPAPPKPTPPPRPKVKVDLNLVDAPASEETVKPKPMKHHMPKPVKSTDETQDNAESSPDNTGLSKEQIAEKLGDKLNAAGSKNAIKSGVSGASDGHPNSNQDYYDLIKQQIQEEWNSPMVTVDVEPIVGMHVERDGRVLPESVHLIRSSGNPAYDDSAVATIKRLGYLREPLPEGCPPDMTINFNPNSTN